MNQENVLKKRKIGWEFFLSDLIFRICDLKEKTEIVYDYFQIYIKQILNALLITLKKNKIRKYGKRKCVTLQNFEPCLDFGHITNPVIQLRELKKKTKKTLLFQGSFRKQKSLIFY